MDREERFARWLDEGAPASEDVPEVAASLEARLTDPNSWEMPPEGLFDSLMSEIESSAPVELDAPIDRDLGRSEDRDNVVPILSAAWSRALIGVAAAVVLVVAVGVGFTLTNRGDPFVMAGTELAPDASAEATVRDTPSGFEIHLDISGLEPAPSGFYYQAWVRNDSGGVTIGTFHAREGGEDVILWSGVDIAEYSTVTVTIQEEGAGAESSGRVVLKGTIGDR